MVKCPYCGVSISTRTHLCPLCHKSLIEAGISKEEIKKTPLDFPKRGKLPVLTSTLFDKVYLLCTLNFIVVAIVAELVVLNRIKFSWLVLSLLIYFYVFLRITIKSSHLFPQKVLIQAIALSVVSIATRRILPDPDRIFEIMLPIIYLISMIIVGIFFIINYKHPSKYLLNIITIAVLGFLPIGISLFEKVPPPPLGIITAVLGAAIIITLFIFYARVIISELKRNFHV